MKKERRWLRRGAFFAPLVLGMIGFAVLDGQPLLDALFWCVTMYALNYGDTPPNFCVELARWTAPLATAGGVIFALESARQWIGSRIKYLGGDSVAVYGPEDEKKDVLAQLGSRGIDGGSRLVKARRYILLDTEEENLTFYRENRDMLKGSMVYLKCASLPAQSAAEAGLKLFSAEETAARLFWKRRELYRLSAASGYQMRIALIGFGRLGEELLYWGLQNNIFDPKQRIEYHVFGDGKAFSAIHTQLSAISDPVVFHDEPWYEQLALLEGAQLVIVLTQEGQLTLLKDLLLATVRPEIDVFTADGAGAALLADRERLRIFDWKREAQKPEHILDDLLFTRAKRINLRYASLYGGVAESGETLEAEWEKLDPFTRYSNVSSADYHEVRLNMLAAMGQSGSGELTAECLELLAELEHMRWCRYHYLNNWRHGVPENGKNKDKGRRIHSDLVPYETLTDGEKEKDRENIRVLLSVDG